MIYCTVQVLHFSFLDKERETFESYKARRDALTSREPASLCSLSYFEPSKQNGRHNWIFPSKQVLNWWVANQKMCCIVKNKHNNHA